LKCDIHQYIACEMLPHNCFDLLLTGEIVVGNPSKEGLLPAPLDRIESLICILDDAPMWQAFRQALRELGYLEGQNIAYKYRYGDGAPERLATAAAELVRQPVDLIATFGTPATRAAKEATATIPIVMIGIGDPVRTGLVASFGRPGGNITGNTMLSPDLGLQILREAIATVTRVAYLVNPDNDSTRATLVELQIAAAAAGMELIPVEVRSATEFDPAFAVMMRERPDALLVSGDPFHQLHIDRIHRVPSEEPVAGDVPVERAGGGRRVHGLRRESS
jgi:ABC-type uncharacterized transport system substrate-binding protein